MLMRPRGTKHETLNEEHDTWASISCSLQATKQHLKHQTVGRKDSASTAGRSVNNLFVRRSVLDRVVKGIMVAVYNKLNQVSFFIGYAYLRVSENIPF
jgi:hypothetical protein